MYRITIEQSLDEPGIAHINDVPPQYRKVYEQTLPDIDLPKLIAAINSRPRKRREKKEAK